MLTILVVDDEKLERKGIRFLLNRRSEEMEILEAANGKAACEILQHRTVDIMLTDIKMPIMDGFAATCEIRKLSPDIPVLALSAFAYDKEKEKAKECNFNDYLVKPVDIPLLKYKIEYYLNKNK